MDELTTLVSSIFLRFDMVDLINCNIHSSFGTVMRIYVDLVCTFLLALTCCGTTAFCTEPNTLTATIKEHSESKKLVIAVHGFGSAIRDELRSLSQEKRLHLAMQVFVTNSTGVEAQIPAVLGSVTFSEDHELVFQGKYPLGYDVPYTVQITTSRMQSSFQVISRSSPKASTTVVQQIYPSTDRIPENVLKFYIEFSAPMSFGQVYQHIELVEEDGTSLRHPFLEVAEELWDPTGRRLTLLLDPARIKRGLVPHEEDGAILFSNRTYTLIVKSTMKDANGVDLKQEYRKKFYTIPSDHNQPSPANWKVGCVKSGTRDELVIRLDEALDHAILQRGIDVLNSQNELVEGAVSIGHHETSWRFSPNKPWQRSAYTLRINERIEDLVGNSIAKPFEVFDDASTKPKPHPVTSLKVTVAEDCHNRN